MLETIRVYWSLLRNKCGQSWKGHIRGSRVKLGKRFSGSLILCNREVGESCEAELGHREAGETQGIR